MKNLLLLCEFDERLENCNIYKYPTPLNRIIRDYDGVLKFIEDNRIDTLLCDSGHIRFASKLLWMSDYLKRYILTDTDNPLLPEENNKEMTAKMWDVIAIQAGDKSDPISQSGWVSSCRNENFTKEEMEEYVKNTVDKLIPYLFQTADVLEIGVASGITCFEIAPLVGKYIGVDISGETLKRTKTALNKQGINNVDLFVADAMETPQLDLGKQDIIIINSVAQYFPGYNYFILLISKLVDCIKVGGVLFF